MTEVVLPSTRTGSIFIVSSLAFFFLASYATLFSAFLPPPGNFVLDLLARDTHYKYFALLIIPTTSWFVIANWVGWQYFVSS
ncbi:uncharacterized protein STEHIDRAFT_51627 [Stereum hirsutum FP-91666 SS1]|uniref:uncharacterized protein n=1 Tax=Stereum hirsutum (strain FP-91666) TaxID=721885 RepID=UPI000440C901|nr:uncharacterized protein STEHIDRAFT_51627 [Stereum hirsutum FP-91666 SS1]EIM89886.1 hypothetical protein STEHIDRAFT_51627 [Stereum hirsutum FP-91666 SS1]